MGTTSPSGALRAPIRESSTADGFLHVPGDGFMYILAPDGSQVAVWGERGHEPWQFIGGSHGLWIDSRGDIYVAQVGVPNAINKFARI